MDFKSFNRAKAAAMAESQRQQAEAKKTSDEKENKTIEQEDLENVAKKYSGKSEDEVMSEILNRVGKSKADGTFEPQQFDSFYSKVAPMLTPDQAKKLRGIIGKLK